MISTSHKFTAKMRRLKVGLVLLHLTAFFALASGNLDDVVIEQIDVPSTKEIADLKVSFSFFDRVIIDVFKCFKFFEQAFVSQINVRLNEMERATKDLKNNGELVAVAVARSFPTTGITTARKTTATDGGCSVYYGGQAPSSKI